MKTFLLALLITGFTACAAEPTVIEERRFGGISVIKITSAGVPHRIVSEVETGTATFGNGAVDSPSRVGGWPGLKSTAPPPDAGYGGFRNLEEFLNATNRRA